MIFYECVWRFFVQQIAQASGLAPRQIGEDAIAVLQAHDWPGNVRELRNFVERSLILGWFDFGPEPVVGAAVGTADESLEAVEKRHILAVLGACEGNKSEAARRLGVSRKTLDRKCQAWSD